MSHSWESSRRRNGTSASSRLRMDVYGAAKAARSKADNQRKKEIDKVMKKARREGATQSSYWTKKLLEAEEKDPNRWRHSGFKELYRYEFGGSSGSASSGSRSRSRNRTRKRTHSPAPPRARSWSRSRGRSYSRDKMLPRPRDRPRTPPSPRSKDDQYRRGKDDIGRRPRSPQSERRDERVRRSISRTRTNSADKRKPAGKADPPASKSDNFRRSKRSRSLGSRSRSLSGRRSLSESRSVSSCSDESCSVCSPKYKRNPQVSPANKQGRGTRSRSFSVPRNQPGSTLKNSRIRSPPAALSEPKKVLDRGRENVSVGLGKKIVERTKTNSIIDSRPPRKELVSPKIKKKDERYGKSIEKPKPSPMLPSKRKSEKKSKDSRSDKPPVLPMMQKIRGFPEPERRSSGRRKSKRSGREGRRRRSDQNGPIDSKRARKRSRSSSDSDSDSSSPSSDDGQPKMTLSERFGKMAQWSVDRREFDSVKMRVIKDANNSNVKVVIEDEMERPLSASTSGALALPRSRVNERSPDRYTPEYERRRYFFERATREAPVEVPLDWDDVRVRYNYYRERVYLWDRDITLEEYIKWEEWWYKYQEWLEMERYYNQMACDREWAQQAYRSGSFERETITEVRTQRRSSRKVRRVKN